MPWPIEHRSENLTVDFFYLQRRIGAAAQFGRVPEEWDDEQEQLVQEIIDEGVRQAYDPPPLMPPYSLTPLDTHEWSFLRPIWEFTTVSGQRRYLLPPDFTSPIGSISFMGSNQDYRDIEYTIPARLRTLENRADDTKSAPSLYAIEPSSTTGEGEQHWNLVLHSTPNTDYKLAMQYQAEPNRLDKDRPYPLGGQQFGQVLLASCMAAAELQIGGRHGPQYSQFLSKLAGAVVRDTKYHADTLGYNGNRHPGEFFGNGTARDLRMIWNNGVTYRGWPT
jgi:hypothetical protein